MFRVCKAVSTRRGTGGGREGDVADAISILGHQLVSQCLVTTLFQYSFSCGQDYQIHPDFTIFIIHRNINKSLPDRSHKSI
jgi:hypothetical protein